MNRITPCQVRLGIEQSILGVAVIKEEGAHRMFPGPFEQNGEIFVILVKQTGPMVDKFLPQDIIIEEEDVLSCRVGGFRVKRDVELGIIHVWIGLIEVEGEVRHVVVNVRVQWIGCCCRSIVWDSALTVGSDTWWISRWAPPKVRRLIMIVRSTSVRSTGVTWYIVSIAAAMYLILDIVQILFLVGRLGYYFEGDSHLSCRVDE
uniref:Uncharacterized protein n=1 Tax=Cacopsylla melanoneura TaxID=428564 RepID=A0A8D9EUH0_9HEMI